MEEGELKVVTFHPAVAAVLEFFEYDHLPKDLQAVSSEFWALAYRTAERAPSDQETTVALRKLLEAKDAAVRAFLRAHRGDR